MRYYDEFYKGAIVNKYETILEFDIFNGESFKIISIPLSGRISIENSGLEKILKEHPSCIENNGEYYLIIKDYSKSKETKIEGNCSNKIKSNKNGNDNNILI